MSNLWKRSLSMLMAIVMVFSMLPAHAIAAELEEGETESIVAETEAPEVEETEAPEIEDTEAPEEEETEAPEEEETEAPEEEETEAPEEEETEAPEEEETEAPEEEETEAPKAELSGETRKVYFYNVEGWDEVWAAWSFDEEDFDDVAHPGEELDAAAVLEDVYVVTVPVEADDVLFSDGIEVTDELLEEEKLAGVEVTHEVEVELESNEKKDYFDGEGWLNYADEVAAVEAAAAEAAKKAEEEAAKQNEPPVMDKAPEPAEPTEVEKVQAVIDALDTDITSDAEYAAAEAALYAADDALMALSEEDQAKVDITNYFEALNALDNYAGVEEEAGNYAEANGWYWEGNILYIKDGKITKGQLYNALVEKYGSGSYKHADSSAKDWNLHGEEVKSGQTDVVALGEATWHVAKKGGTSLSDWTGWGTKASKYSYTVKHYYVVTTAIAAGAPAGAGISVATKNVVKDSTVKVTVNTVDGYTASVTDSKGNAVTNLDAYAPTESTTLTVTYTSNQVAKYKVTVEEVNGDWGTATLKSNDELVAGAEAVVEVSVADSGSNTFGYYLKSVKVGETDLSTNEYGNYVYTMGEADATIKVTFAKETFELESGEYEILVNNYSNTTKAESELKKQVLDDVLEGTYDIDDYKVELLTTIDLGFWSNESYYNVEGEVLDLGMLGKHNIDAAWFVTQLKVDGKTENNFKVTKLAASNQSGKDLYIENVMFTADESRLAAEIKLTKTEFNVDQVSEVEALVKAAVQYNKNGEWPDIDDSHVTVSAITAAGKQNVTITVTKESADYLKNETGINPEITVTLNPYTVTWIVGTDSDVDTYNVGGTIVAPEVTAIPEGHSFAGWDGNDDGVVDEVAATMGKSNLTYKAVFTPNTYTVTWTVNGETFTTTEVVYGKAITAPAYTTPEGHTFSGWTNIPEKMPAEDITLDATLTKNQYKITWKYQTAEGVWTEYVNEEQYFGELVNLPGEDDIIWDFAIDENTTWTIVGWDGLNKDHTVPSNNDTEFVAKYSSETVYKVTFKSGNDTILIQSIIPTDDLTDNDVVVEPEEPKKENHRFDGWYANEEFTTKYEFGKTPDANVTVYAKWVEQVTVSFNVTGVAPQTFDINGKATEPTGLDKEYAIFGGWLLDGEAYDFTAPVTKNIALTANWIADVNDNNKLDEEETITIVVNKADDADAVAVEATDAEAKAPVEKTLSTADGTKSYVFDSTKPGIKITAKPVVSEDGISSTYVTSINGEVLSYGENFAASVEMKAEKDAVITVDFDKAEFTYDEDGELRYYVGINTPIAEDLYNAVITDPVYNAECVTDSEGNPTITYLARPAGEYSIRIPVLYEVDLGELLGAYSGLLGILGIPEKIQIGGNKYDMSLEEAWWNVGKPVPTMTEEELLAVCDAEVEAIKAKIATIKIEVSALAEAWEIIQECWADVEDLIAVLSTQAESLGFHEFGADYTYTITDADGNKQTMTARKDADGNIQEVMQVVYTNDAMCLKDDEVIITLVDDRIPTTLVADNLTFEYDEYDNSTLLNSIALKDNEGNTLTGLLDQNGNPVAPKLGSNMSGKEVGEYSFVVSFAGNYDYKPSTAEFTLTVIKAPSNTDVKDQNITYPAKVTGPVITNKHGNVIDVEAFEFILGLDVASLNIDSNGVQGFAGKVQLIVPESLQAIMDAIGLSEGASLSLSELTNLLNNELLSGILGEWGVTSDVIGALDGVLGAISDAVDTTDLKIVIGGDYPTNVGAYLHGAVTVDKNYETSYDVGYILIKPQTTEYHLEWSDPALTNAVVTLPMFNAIKDKGACAVEDEEFEVSYVILGVNDDESKILSTDVYGNIKANIWLNADEIKSNGAYMQIAYGIEWGNEFNYAMPIVRGFAVVPAVYDVQLVGANGTPNDELLKEFNNKPQGFSVIVKDNNGKIIYSDHYQNVVELKENAQLVVNYVGVQTNGQPYNGTKKPVHAGVYAATAIYMEFNDGEKLDISDLKVEDLYELFDLADIGMDAALLVIEPAESTVIVEEKIVNYDSKTDILFKDMVKAGSAAEGLKPDTTIISAGIDTDAAFSESGWDAVRGIVNVDFPAWMDALLEQYAPSVKAGMSVAELKDVLLNKLPDISDKLVELGATEEMVNSLANLTGNVASVLAEMPDNIRLSFVDDAKANEIGAYIVTAVVTDSDHYPSVDAGYLVVVPDVDVFELKWNFEDGNGIFTRDLLDLNDVDLLAKAYDAKSGAYNEDATGKISYMFVGIDSNGKFEHYTDPATLPNGAYIELAYIELDVEGEMVVSDMIARPIVVVASNCKVNVENVETVFNNTAHGVKITVTDLEGREIDTDNGTLTVLYAGLQTNGKAYMDTKAPVHAGVYEALVTYTETVDGELRYYGANAGYVLIDLAESNIDVTGETVTYDGNGHTATVVATGSGVTEPDYTLISGGAYVSGDIDEIGVDAFHGNVNIDLPTWMDKALAGYEFVDGVNAAKVADYIEAYRDELIASVKLDKLVEWNVMTEEEAVATIAKLNAYIDELVAVLKKMPTDVALTFVDDITYTEPGAYFYYGIVTDSDHYPSTDTGLLVIEKMDMVYDLLDTDYAWDGTGKMVEIYNPNNADALTLIIDRVNNTANFLIDNDAQYLLNTVARILGVEFDGDVQMSTILEKYNGAEVADAIVKMITEAEKLDLPEENAKALAAVKKQLQDLPADGTIVINGELPSEIGTYDVYAVSYSQYYKTNASEAELLIVPAHFGDILVTDVTYNGTEQTGEVVVKTGDGLTLDPSEYTVTGNKGTNAGAYTVTVEGINHYEGTVTLTWNILPAPVTITADAKTKVYGEDDPELTCTVTGLVNGETEAVLNIALDREDGEKVGEYEITATASNGNYAITIVPNTFTITKKAITVTADDVTKVYGEKDPTFTATIDTLVDGDKLNVTFTREDGENVGEYKITPAVDALVNTRVMGNYDITCEQGTLTITKKAASITANDKTMVAGNPVPALDATVEGVIGEDTLNYTLSTKDPVAIGEHGTYEIVVTPGENPNYEVNWTNGNLIAQKCALTVDGVAYTDWASAMADISDSVANIKLYADVRYYDASNLNQTQFPSNSDITLDLNGFKLNFHGTVNVNPGTTLNVVGGGSFTMEVAGWPLVLTNNVTLKMDESVAFTGTIQMNNFAKSNYYIGDECIIGNSDEALFQTTGDSNFVTVKFADGVMDLALQNGHLTLTKDLTTLDGQKVVISEGSVKAPAKLTIAKDKTLTLNPATTIEVEGTVDGEGTIAVASAEHLALALSTDVANVKLIGSDEDTNIAMVEDGTVTLDLNKQSMKVGSLTVTGNMVIKDTASGDATPEAGKLLGTITVADGASLTLYAGTYSQDVQDYVADGYYAHDNGDGTWTVLKQIKLQSATDNTLRYYIGEAQGPEAADFRVVAENGDVLTADQFAVLAAQQTNAGTYTATILPTYRAYTGMVENVVWGILPAQITVTVDDVTIDVDDKIPAQDATDRDPKLTYTMTVDKPDVTGADLEALIAKLTDEVKVEITANVEQNDAKQNIVGTYENTVEYVESANYVVNVVKGNVIVELGDYICWNINTGVYYNDVSDGLMATVSGQTLQMLKDATTANKKNELVAIINADTKFDLNGYYVETANLLSYGVVFDTTTGKDSKIADDGIATGGILISNNTAVAWTMLQPDNGGYLPIYDTTTGSYKFYAGSMKSVVAHSTDANSVRFYIQILFNEAEGYQILGRSGDSKLVSFNVIWTGVENFEIEYFITDDNVRDFGDTAYSQMMNKGSVTTGIFMGANGLTKLGAGAQICATPKFVSTTTVTSVGSEMVHTVR